MAITIVFDRIAKKNPLNSQRIFDSKQLLRIILCRNKFW